MLTPLIVTSSDLSSLPLTSNACLTVWADHWICSIQYNPMFTQCSGVQWLVHDLLMPLAHCHWTTQDKLQLHLPVPGLDQPTLFSFRKYVFDSRKPVAIISNFTSIFIKTKFRFLCIITRTGHISSDKKSNKVVSVYFICFWKVLWTARIFIYWTFKTILDRNIRRNRVVFRNIF